MYHRGTYSDVPVEGGRTIHLSLMPNPSHLEGA
jgi:2-oxoglutarate dehydrogenase complex dehydrogenase (E1) component-like enzyme